MLQHLSIRTSKYLPCGELQRYLRQAGTTPGITVGRAGPEEILISTVVINLLDHDFNNERIELIERKLPPVAHRFPSPSSDSLSFLFPIATLIYFPCASRACACVIKHFFVPIRLPRQTLTNVPLLMGS